MLSSLLLADYVGKLSTERKAFGASCFIRTIYSMAPVKIALMNIGGHCGRN